MSIRVRKLVLVLHVISSVSWLGLTIGNLVLAITAMSTAVPADQHAAYRVMGLLGDVLLVPISLTAFATGVVLGLGTKWGLFRHYWVIVKFGLTLVAVLLTPFALLPGLHTAVAVVSATPSDQLADVGSEARGALMACCVSLTMYTTMTVLSVLKPWGRRKKVPGPRRSVPVLLDA